MNSSPKIKTGVRVPELDGLRGLAILIVLFHHYVFIAVRPEDGWLATLVRLVAPLSWSGVDLFFVLSGYLIGGILLDQRDTEYYFRTFYIRRICRIFPFYFLWLALFFILPGVLSPRWHQIGALFATEGIPKWSYVCFVQNFHMAGTGMLGASWLAPTWSLAIEEQFYLLAPLTIWLIPVRKLPLVLLALTLCVPAFRVYLYLWHPGIFEYVLLPCRADTLLMGILCACWVRNETSRRWLEKHPDRLYLALLVLLAGAGYLTAVAHAQRSFDGLTSFEMVSFGYSWIALLYACLLLIVVTRKQGVFVHLTRFTPLRYLGIISYSVYLMHMAINSLVHDLILGQEPHLINLSSGMVTFLALLFTLLLATFSWHYFEKPILRWGHSFSYTTPKTRHAA